MPKKTLVAGLTASLLVHVFLVLGLAWSQRDPASAGTELLLVDVEIAPPPEAVDEPEPIPVATAPAEPVPAAVAPVTPPRPDEPSSVGDDERDAGPPPPPPRDAGPPTDPVVAIAGDGGPALPGAMDDAGPSPEDAGPPGPTLQPAATSPATYAVDLGPHVPTGDNIAVLIRLDRLRGSPWAGRIDAILRPMPDHRSIMGDRAESIADSFDILVISSSDPTDVAATNLAARGPMDAAAVRRLLDRRDQPVSWSVARGGPLGQRGPSPLTIDRDARVYLQPLPGWIVLTQPGNLGALLEPAAGAIEDARAVVEELPPFLGRLPLAEQQAGDRAGTIAVMSVRLKRKRLMVPQVGVLPAPSLTSVALELVPGGFAVRGTLRFRNDAAAVGFETVFGAARLRLLGSPLSQAILRNLHGYNALNGLTLRRAGAAIAFGTTLSGADGKAAMELAADWATRFYHLPPSAAAAPLPPSR